MNITLYQKSHLRSLIKASFGRFNSMEIDLNAKASALKGVVNLEKTTEHKFSPKLKKLADEYAIDVFGNKKYAYWLYVYTMVQGDFKEGWIPENFSSKYVEPVIGLNSVSLYKTFTNTILQTELLPDIAYYIDGIFYRKNLSVISFTDLLKDIKDYEEVVLKGDNSYQGKAIWRYKSDEIQKDFFKKIGNCVIQKFVVQHHFFDEVISASLATMRIVTVRNLQGGIEFRASHVKFGRDNDQFVTLDNFFRIAIVDRLGTLDSFGYTYDWKRHSTHPDTNYDFANKSVPLFNEAVNTCISLHKRVPNFRIIGWDIAIDSDEKIMLLEWNAANPGIKFSEATFGPCFTGLDWEKLNVS